MGRQFREGIKKSYFSSVPSRDSVFNILNVGSSDLFLSWPVSWHLSDYVEQRSFDKCNFIEGTKPKLTRV